MAQADEPPIVAKLLAYDAEWQKVCDRFTQQVLDAGSELTAEQEVNVRKSITKDAAVIITELLEALDFIAVGEGCMSGNREELPADVLRNFARHAHGKALAKAGAA